MSTKHMPGAWYASGDEVLVDMGDRAHLIATVADWSEDTEDYARLIAASPDLLSELQAMTDAYAKAMKDAGVTGYPEALATVRKARAAIAKATKELTND